MRAYRQLGRFEARSNFATWLYRIGFNCAIDYMRARPHRESAEATRGSSSCPARASGPSTDDLVYASEIGGRVQEALEALSPQERAAFLMRHYQGCSIEEICRALDLRIERREALDFPGGEEDARRAAAADGRTAVPTRETL